MINWDSKKKWIELGFDDENQNKDKIFKNLKESLLGAKINEDIAALVAQEMLDSSGPAQNTVFIFTEDDIVVTAIHVPFEALGSDGPVLARGANDKSIIACFSKDKIMAMLDKLDSDDSDDPAEDRWIKMLDELADLVRFEIRVNPPETWEKLLDGDL
jgi:hypothetical protein